MNKGFYVYLVWSKTTKTVVYTCVSKEKATESINGLENYSGVKDWYYTEEFVLGSDYD